MPCAAAPACADVGATIINRCTHGQSLAGFTQQDYRKALQELSFQLSGAQLGITLTALLAGYLAEPAISHLLEPALKPLTGAIVIVEVADAPGATVAGASAVAAIVKSGATAAVTVKLRTLV